jgi:hypothetical protein
VLLLAGITLPACVRSAGRPPDPALVPAGGGVEKTARDANEEEKEATQAEQKNEPLVPQILAEEVEADARQILGKLAEAEDAIAKIMQRELSKEQSEQVEVARSFLEQAKAALAEDDLQRAAVLADKGAALARGIEEASRD